jgi:hypothetical protein
MLAGKHTNWHVHVLAEPSESKQFVAVDEPVDEPVDDVAGS